MSVLLEVKELSDNMQRMWKQFKETNDKEIDALKKDRGVAQLTEQLAKINTDLDAKEKALQQKLADLEAKFKAPMSKLAAEEKAAATKDAFFEWARKGMVDEAKTKLLQDVQGKALIAADDTTGGYLAPTEVVNEIIKGVVEMSPVRELARVRVTSTRSSRHPKRTGLFAAQWIAEQGTRDETTGLKYGSEEIPNHEIYARVDVSKQDLDDSMFNLETEINGEMSEQFGVAEGTAFLFGNSVGKAEGILFNAEVLANQFVNATGSAGAALAADDLIDAFYKLKDSYARNATWMIKRATIGSIRKLKGSDNNYLWQPGLADGSPPQILGAPYREALDMEVVGAVSRKIVLLGDFRKGYVISDRQAIEMLRDPFTERTKGNIKFQGNKRLGGQVVLAEAFVYIKTTA